MSDTHDLVREVFGRSSHVAKVRAHPAPATPSVKSTEQSSEEDHCGAFGYVRGLDARAIAVRFCFRNGTSVCMPYTWLGPWEFNPAVGLLVKFTGDAVTLVLIRGSNLDMQVNGSVNLTEWGLQQHRVTWVREMDDDELQKAGEAEPTVDGIDTGTFDSHEKLRDWVKRNAPAFLGGLLVPT
jgi:hypothetical protein